MNARDRGKIVLLGMMTKMPVAGVVWQVIHYLLGFERLGYDAYYVEAHARTPSMLMDTEHDDGATKAADFIAGVMRRFGLADRWAYQALHADGRCYGMDDSALHRLYRNAALIINLHGGTAPRPEHYETGRLVYLETDPVQLQVELHNKQPATVEFLEPHVAFFTFAENYGRPDCHLPVSDQFDFRPTRQPVVLGFWGADDGEASAFTTIGSWRQPWRDVRLNGQLYGWSKREEYMKIRDLPGRVNGPLELALASCPPEDRRLLQQHGWIVRDADALSWDLDGYQTYIRRSRGEFTVAKDQNVRLRSGWFSDRSASYLAAGRPVITQDTGFGSALPTGSGLFAYGNADHALAAIEAINADYTRHRRSARELALDYFSSDVVLGHLLDEVGLEQPDLARPDSRALSPRPLPTTLDLSVVRKRPTTLADKTVRSVLTRPVPHEREVAATSLGAPTTSVVVVTFGDVVFTRMCLETLLSTTAHDCEIIVVNNALTADTSAYLDALGERFRSVHVHHNAENRGFVGAVNQGLAMATGDVLVILNNDVVLTPRWLDGLARHLQDTAVGLVGPVTNAAGNQARIAVQYRTYGELFRFAARRSVECAGIRREIEVVNLFCAAMRRDTYTRVGALDEGFGLGLFEDDDYAMRVRAAGLRVVCADDVFVHHFGEASFGDLVPNGDYGRIFEANRQRFEDKWQLRWRSHAQHCDPRYGQLVDRVRDTMRTTVPAHAVVLVVSKGDDEILRLEDRCARHFPALENGTYAGHHPADSDAAIAELEAARANGAEYLVFPATALWWLEYYEDFERHLKRHYSVAAHSEDCVIYHLDSGDVQLPEDGLGSVILEGLQCG